MSTSRRPLDLPASMTADPLSRRLYPPPGLAGRISSWFSGWARWLGEKYTAVTSTRFRRRCLLGGIGLFCVWWGFSVQFHVSTDFQSLYREVASQSQPETGSYISPFRIANEVRTLGWLSIVFGLPLVWVALFDWLWTEKSTSE